MKGRATVEVTFEVLPLERYFETVVTGDDTERHKPDPEPLLLALERLGASPSAAAYVGDSPFDIRAAKAAGMVADRGRLGRYPPAATSRGGGAQTHVVQTPGELHDVV